MEETQPPDIPNPSPTSPNSPPQPSPPESCYPPCLWDLLKDCRPVSSCIQETGETQTIFCESSTGWRREKSNIPSEPLRSVTSLNGEICYSFSVVELEGGAFVRMFRNALGENIAYIDRDPSIYFCLERGQGYRLNYTNPACAPFEGVACEEGVCDG